MGFLQSCFNISTIATLVTKTKPDYAKAGLDTLIGMGTVFIVLIFISLLISAFKIFSVIQNKMSKKNAINSGVVSSVDQVISQISEREEESLNDDLELVAVITAAIMASMGADAPADGLIVRSIRRRK